MFLTKRSLLTLHLSLESLQRLDPRQLLPSRGSGHREFTTAAATPLCPPVTERSRLVPSIRAASGREAEVSASSLPTALDTP
ncbi:MAG: hypothetical protein V7K48_23985 [Nostoc sp.]|uniref:hypothetical protein n=1 Tax=Nostoc sp. TaxID=1180 RepID=UPI002FFD278C